MHNIGNNGINANLVLLYICSFLLYLLQMKLLNSKLNISVLKVCIIKLQSSLILVISNGRAKTKLTTLSFLYCGEFMKTLIQIQSLKESPPA